ncbi:hypothetical protein OAR88_00100 [bacterium]|jgi:hypothetical protein|nr:hypothetical protein [bacterium]
MKTAVVQEVKPVGEPRQGQYGMMYTYGVRFDNGDSGLYTSTNENQNKFVVGESAHYLDEAKQSKTGKTWFKIKPANPQYDGQVTNAPHQVATAPSTGGGATTSKDVLIVRQTALKAAAEFAASMDANHLDVLRLAESFKDWVLDNDTNPLKEQSTESPF